MSHEGCLVSVEFSFIASHLDSHAGGREGGKEEEGGGDGGCLDG